MSAMSTPPDERADHAARHPLPVLGVILVAAGRGERLGAGRPKAFVELGGRTLLEHCVREITSLPHGGHLVAVVPDDLAGETLALVAASVPAGSPWEVSVTPGGRERHESVRFGLDLLPEHLDTVLVHDAARPLAPSSVFERVAAWVHRTGESVIPGLPVADTLKRVDSDGTVHETVDRAPLVAVQTPQGFPRELLAAAHAEFRAAGAGGDAPTDDAEVVQRAGGTVRTIAGDTLAHKVTTPGDLALLEALRSAESRTGGAR